jgi:hypothetical protein
MSAPGRSQALIPEGDSAQGSPVIAKLAVVQSQDDPPTKPGEMPVLRVAGGWADTQPM